MKNKDFFKRTEWTGGIPEVKVTPSYSGKQVKSKDKFIKGPIPLWWLIKAAALPGHKVLHTAVALWYLKGLNKSGKGLRLSPKTFEYFNVSRQAVYRALNTLEANGLVEIKRGTGQKTRVDIIEAGGGDGGHKL